MATIKEITAAGKKVRTVGEARGAIGQALRDLGAAYKVATTAAQRRALDSARAPLENWYRELRALSDARTYQPEFGKRFAVIARAYVEIAGVSAEVLRASEITYLGSVAEQAPVTFRAIGAGVKEVGNAVGGVAGSVVGGLASGLGPIVVLAIALLVWAKFFRKA